MYKIIGADEKEYGPITTDQIRQWITEGRVNAQTKVCAEGTQDWKPLGSFPEFGPASSTGSSTSSEPSLIPAKPPGVIKVFGILNIVFGGLALLCSPFTLITIPMMSKQMGYSSFMLNWLIFSIVLGIAGGGVMVASGIGLLKLKSWARKLAIYYSVFAVIIALINPLITLTNLPEGGPNPATQKVGAIIGAVFGLAIGLTYNALLIFFLNKRSVKEALGEKV